MARPKLPIDEKQVFELAKLGASNVDIAKVVGCSEALIRGRFCDIVGLGRSERRNTLHSWQWKSAEKGNVNMLIWLGKQELGQSEKTETRTEVTTIVQSHAQNRMLHSERAFDLACELEAEIIGDPAPSAYDAATRDDPGGIRPPGQ